MNIDSSNPLRGATRSSGPDQSGGRGRQNSCCEKSRKEDSATLAQLLQALQAQAATNTPNEDPSTSRLAQLIALLKQTLGLSDQDTQGLEGAQGVNPPSAAQITGGEGLEADVLPQSAGVPQLA